MLGQVHKTALGKKLLYGSFVFLEIRFKENPVYGKKPRGNRPVDDSRERFREEKLYSAGVKSEVYAAPFIQKRVGCVFHRRETRAGVKFEFIDYDRHLRGIHIKRRGASHERAEQAVNEVQPPGLQGAAAESGIGGIPENAYADRGYNSGEKAELNARRGILQEKVVGYHVSESKTHNGSSRVEHRIAVAVAHPVNERLAAVKCLNNSFNQREENSARGHTGYQRKRGHQLLKNRQIKQNIERVQNGHKYSAVGHAFFHSCIDVPGDTLRVRGKMVNGVKYYAGYKIYFRPQAGHGNHGGQHRHKRFIEQGQSAY